MAEREPVDTEFEYNRDGKPGLIGQGSPLEFNVSHSSDAAAFAFSCAGAVDVDVQRRASAEPGFAGAPAVRPSLQRDHVARSRCLSL
jgi:phosphopantetheinyl transferase